MRNIPEHLVRHHLRASFGVAWAPPPRMRLDLDIPGALRSDAWEDFKPVWERRNGVTMSPMTADTMRAALARADGYVIGYPKDVLCDTRLVFYMGKAADNRTGKAVRLRAVFEYYPNGWHLRQLLAIRKWVTGMTRNPNLYYSKSLAKYLTDKAVRKMLSALCDTAFSAQLYPLM